MDVPRCRHLFSLCHRRIGEGEKKGRSWKNKRGGEKKKKRARRVKLLTGCYCPWRVFKAGKGSLEKENGTLHANCDFAFIVRKTQASQCIGWLMQPFHLQYALHSSSIQRLWNDFRLWFGWIIFLNTRIFLDGLEKYFRHIAGIGNSCFPPNVDMSNLFYNLISTESETKRKKLTQFMPFHLWKGFW